MNPLAQLGKIMFLMAILFFISPPGKDMKSMEWFIYMLGVLGIIMWVLAS